MELRPLATLSLELASDHLFMLGATPVGQRIIQEIKGAHLAGERIDATLKGQAAADWLAVDAAGRATFDIRMLLETVDGALVYLTYEGKADWSKGMGTAPIYAVATFETGDDRYRWLNGAPVVGKGELGAGGGVVYEFSELA